MKSGRALIRRFEKSLANHGVLGTCRHCLAFVRNGIRNAMPAARHAQTDDRTRNREFDRRLNIDTSGILATAGMEINSPNWVYSTGYGPVNPDNFVEILNECRLPFEEFTFIDFGSGKGRAVLLAATFPFKKVVGVEFSTELHAIAERNLRDCPAADRRCQHVELLCMDATDYRLPESPLVLFLNNPFEQPLMARVVEQVRQSFFRQPRRMVVLYFEAKQAALWDQVEFLTKTRYSPHIVYQTNQQ